MDRRDFIAMSAASILAPAALVATLAIYPRYTLLDAERDLWIDWAPEGFTGKLGGAWKMWVDDKGELRARVINAEEMLERG